MNFENDYWKINIEKKELSEEQKEARKLRMKKRRPIMVTALVLAVIIVGVSVLARLHTGEAVQQVQTQITTNSGKNDAGAGGNGTGDAGSNVAAGNVNGEATEEYGRIEGEYMETSKFATSLQDKYADQSLYGYTYGEPIENVGRMEPITFELGYDVADLGVDKWTDVFALYQDPELTYTMGVKYDFDPETGIFTMMPTDKSVPCRISLLGVDVGTVEEYPHNRHYFFEEGAGTSWGNMGTAYLASYRDKETGELLEQPEVSIVTFEAEIKETPTLTYTITEDGRARFRWNEVEGAKEYFFCEVQKSESMGYNDSLVLINSTDQTEWITEYPEYGHATANEDFRTFTISEDQWKDESNYEHNLETYGEPGVPASYLHSLDTGFCVIAVNEEGTSMISNICEASDIAPKLPYTFANNTQRESGYPTDYKDYESVDALPTYNYITMCDGYTATKLIDYETEKAYIEEKTYMLLDEETGEVTGGTVIPCLCIPYRVEGTSFLSEFNIAGPGQEGYNEADFEKDIAFLEDREAKLTRKSGNLEFDSTTKYGAFREIKREEIRKVESDVFANSALSEYLATNMLGGVDIIDLSDFPEASDISLVDDAIMEAYYQNPLILGIKGYRMSTDGDKIRIIYEESLESQAEKQEAIKDKVTEIVDKIITEDMTELDKVLAINQYLCDTIVYDEEALANAEENDFAQVDEMFYDSFNAYGALINGKCVCAGYAAAFRLLAEEAGLESIVVTGYLDGNLAHAWNKVKIDDEWYIVDTTNNDNEYFFNALLNLPAEVSDRILVEDKEYMMDARIPMYTGESEEKEYYHITENYFPTEEVARILAEELAEDGTATLRTDYELGDSEFYEITDAVYDIMGDDIDLYGYHWLGVIYLTTEE